MGDVLLHCRGRPTLAPQPASVGLGAQTWLLPGAQTASGHCAFSGTRHYAMPCWSPGQGGRPPSSCGGRQCGTPGLSHPACPWGQARRHLCSWEALPQVSQPISAEHSSCRLPLKSLSQRLMDWVPHLSSIPATLGHPPHSPPLPAQPYPFQVELSWGGGSKGEGEKELEETSRRRGARRGSTGEEEQGIQLATNSSWVEKGSSIQDQLLNDTEPGLGVMRREGVGFS